MKAMHLYPLRDPIQFDDEFGEGFDHVIFNIEEDAGYYLSDAWVVNSKGEVHPGYNESPVPVLMSDVDEEAAVPYTGRMPEPAGIYGGWSAPRTRGV